MGLTVEAKAYLDNRVWRTLLIAVSAGTMLGLLSPNIAPFQIGALIDQLGFSEQSVGLLVTAELLVVSSVALLSAPLFSRISCARFALVGVKIALVGQVATMLLEEYSELMMIRVVAAIGLGMIYAAANAAGAKAEDPEKLFSYGISGSLVIFACLLPTIAIISTRFGYQGMYGAIALFMLVCIPFLRGLNASGPAIQAEVERQPVPWIRLFNLLTVLIIFNIGTGAVWTFVERAGVRVGMDADAIGTLVGLSTLAGIAGSLAVSWVGGRFGRTLPLLIGLSFGGVACYFIASGISALLYALACVGYWVSYMFMYPYLVGIACMLDKSGRSSAAAAGTLMMSFSMGPLVASYLVSAYSFQALAWFGLLTCVAAALLLVPLTLYLDREDAA